MECVSQQQMRDKTRTTIHITQHCNPLTSCRFVQLLMPSGNGPLIPQFPTEKSTMLLSSPIDVGIWPVRLRLSQISRHSKILQQGNVSRKVSIQVVSNQTNFGDYVVLWDSLTSTSSSHVIPLQLHSSVVESSQPTLLVHASPWVA